jgi:MFS family permease
MAASRSLGRVVLSVFLPFAGGYYLSYLYRSVNAVVAPDLVADIGLGAADLGLMTAAYFLAFAAAQLPLGVALDRFGPRRVQACLLLSAALGALIFSLAESRETLILGRALIGLGVAGGLMASFKAIVLWFPAERLPLVNGCFMAFGGVGAMSATAPVEALLGLTDWRGLFVGLAVLTCAAAALIYLAVPEKPGTLAAATLREQVRGLGQVYRDRLFWRLAPMNCAMSATAFSLQGLWAGPWLRDVAGLDRGAVAEHLLVMAGAMTLGMALSGLAADVARRYRIGLIAVMAAGIAVFMAIQVAIVLEAVSAALLVWALFGLFSNVNALAYAALSQHFPSEVTGRAITGFNVLLFSAAFFAQYAVGAVIEQWPANATGGYASEGYQAAFAGLLALQLAAYVWFVWPRGKAKSALTKT